MDEVTLKKIMRQKGLTLTDDKPLAQKGIILEDVFKIVLKPKDQSDRTSFRRIAKWVIGKCEDGSFDEFSIFKRVVDFALEATSPNCKNPAAVFTAILKKELGYKK
jgi:hypothetical protein